MSNTTNCESCGAEIIFVASATTNKLMPLDAKPEKRIILVDLVGVLVGGLEPRGARARVVDTYISHFATCEFADQHRRTDK